MVFSTTLFSRWGNPPSITRKQLASYSHSAGNFQNKPEETKQEFRKIWRINTYDNSFFLPLLLGWSIPEIARNNRAVLFRVRISAIRRFLVVAPWCA